ncbi:MAG: isocitrate lyase/phosphoenolpyruvate mutase family protein [Hyphomicrobiaceae bacterium]|nr:isocitrate lyase/phosphoenolpyruvate mutase family protein [Hyphomicrobiaceae bacterium]
MDTTFRDLHRPGQPFILANAWDIGSARMLAALGAEALATSSAAFAFTLGLPDGGAGRDASIAHGKALADATPLPVSGDFENGFGDSPEIVAETVRLAAEAGLAGCSIEDTAGAGRSYDFAAAVTRIEAAADAARKAIAATGRDFVLLARADGMLVGTYDNDEAIRRLRAFSAAGADALYAPLPPDMEALAAQCRAVDKPVNGLCAGLFTHYSRADFANAGVARISLGSSLARATHKVILDAGRAMFETGDFSRMGEIVPSSVVNGMLTRFMG